MVDVLSSAALIAVQTEEGESTAFVYFEAVSTLIADYSITSPHLTLTIP